MKNINKVLFVAALSVAASTHAAQDGTLGATSTGETDVLLIKDNAVQITNVDDLDLGTYSSVSAAIEASDDVCIFNSTASYQVTITSDNTVFELDAGGTDTIPYTVTWADSSATDTVALYNTPITGLQGDRTSPNCSGGTNASFAVSVEAATFNNAAPGVYVDTLTLMIEPE